LARARRSESFRGRIVKALRVHLGEPLEFVRRQLERTTTSSIPRSARRTGVYWADPRKVSAPNTVHR
jgi:hypothetical protein